MPTDRTPSPVATDDRANYDYRSDDVDRPGLVEDLQGLIDGDVRFDSYSRELYATDASIYEQTPIGVVFPTGTADVAAVMEYCAERAIPVLPRGGGTSLAGQAVNEAVVLDFTRHMDDVLDLRPDEQRARVRAGITLGDLNDRLAEHDLKFAPDPAWGDKSVLGGAIGNNSTGAHSLKYGKTDAYVESCEVVLADGTVTEFGEIAIDELRERADPDGDLTARIYAEVARILDEQGDVIAERYPDLKRNVSGYNLDWLVHEARGELEQAHGDAVLEGASERGEGERSPPGTVNLARLLAGSEGTLAIVTEAEVSLEPVPETKSLAMLTYRDLLDAMEDVATILEHDPAAVELVDDVLIDLARETAEFADVVATLPEGTAATLLVEFYAADDEAGRRKVANLLSDRLVDPDTAARPTAENGSERVVTGDPVRAFDAVEAHEDAERAKIWKLRKSGLPILLSRTTDEKHVAFIEDTAIPPENLPEYVADVQAIFDDVGTFASFYAHAGPGVLHIRPLVNTKTDAGLARMEEIADRVTDLVVEYGGSVSGEHGDGRARTQWNHKLYGDELWETFTALKTAFDPDWLLNPGQVVYRDDDPTDMTEHLRFDPDYEFEAGFEPVLNWDNDNGMQGMVELCHGCGGCRGPQHTTGGVMCPTYRASQEEITATRGRANMLRQAMSGDLPEDAADEEFVTEVLDLCIGCKGCAKDCPSEVDMAKLKAEVTHEYHQRHGVGLRDRLFANVHALSTWGSRLAPLSNWASSLPGAGWLAEKTVGIARERTLPTFYRETFRDWFVDRGGPAVAPGEATRHALVVPDTYTNYSHPEAGIAAVEVLEAAGVHVQLADVEDTGRPAHSKGMLDASWTAAKRAVDHLAPRVRDGWDVVVVEPSDAVMLQHDYRDLLDDEPDTVQRTGEDVPTERSRPDVAVVAENTYAVCEYVDRFRLDEAVDWTAPETTLTYHGHCHQKATTKDHHAVGVLRRAGYAVDPLDSGCCGMAGSFGYEAEHHSMSMAIGEILFDQIRASPGETVVAPGASCRTQLGDRPGADEEPPTPIEMLARALA